jgi:hypothetical protein
MLNGRTAIRREHLKMNNGQGLIIGGIVAILGGVGAIAFGWNAQRRQNERTDRLVNDLSSQMAAMSLNVAPSDVDDDDEESSDTLIDIERATHFDSKLLSDSISKQRALVHMKTIYDTAPKTMNWSYCVEEVMMKKRNHFAFSKAGTQYNSCILYRRTIHNDTIRIHIVAVIANKGKFEPLYAWLKNYERSARPHATLSDPEKKATSLIFWLESVDSAVNTYLKADFKVQKKPTEEQPLTFMMTDPISVHFAS